MSELIDFKSSIDGLQNTVKELSAELARLSNLNAQLVEMLQRLTDKLDDKHVPITAEYRY